MSKIEVYLDFLRFSIGSQTNLSFPLKEMDWGGLFEFAKKQAIVGTLFVGINKFNAKEIGIPYDILYEWISLSEQIKIQNKILNKRAVEVSQFLSKAGYRNCILKGQGNALLYPDAYSRTSGDIDIWIEGSRKEINRFVKENFPKAHGGYTHIDFPIFEDVIVEVHYIPSSMYSHKFNRRLQLFYTTHADEQYTNVVKLPDNSGAICVPTPMFNIVHQMSHIMNHFFVEGIGLRQFVDYYYLLKSLSQDKLNCDVKSLFKDLGLYKFSKGVMWILKEAFGLDESYLLVEPDRVTGLLILREIQIGGNFGFYDKRYSLRKYGAIGRGVSDTYRLFKMTKYFPSESLWSIEKKLVHQFWKK